MRRSLVVTAVIRLSFGFLAFSVVNEFLDNYREKGNYDDRRYYNGYDIEPCDLAAFGIRLCGGVVAVVAVVVIVAVVCRFDNVIFNVETVKADGCVFVGNVGGYGLRQSVSVKGFGVEFDSADFSVFIFKTFVFFADVFFVFVVVTRSGFYAFSVELVIVKRVFKFVFGGYRFRIAYEVE
ncbi:unknown [Acidiphilium sp. CAG:727]|nr:unknown [Acidiphilium sp. CAG:727]